MFTARCLVSDDCTAVMHESDCGSIRSKSRQKSAVPVAFTGVNKCATAGCQTLAKYIVTLRQTGASVRMCDDCAGFMKSQSDEDVQYDLEPFRRIA